MVATKSLVNVISISVVFVAGMGDDVQPVSLTDEDDFFSDLDGEEPHVRGAAIGNGSRLVLNLNNRETPRQNSRMNPFGNTELRSRITNNVVATSSTTNETTTTPTAGASTVYLNQNESSHNGVSGGVVDVNGRSNGSIQTEATPCLNFQANNVNGQSRSVVASRPDVQNNLNHVVDDNASSVSSASSIPQQDSNSLSSLHCHIPHEHEEDNTVRNQLIAVSVFTTLFGIGETIGKKL